MSGLATRSFCNWLISMMHVIEAPSFFIHSPSIPMTLKDNVGTDLRPSRTQDMPAMAASHQEILEMHSNSESSALLYVGVVLIFYVLALVLVLCKYRRSELSENRLTRLYDDFICRDRYLRRIAKNSASEALVTGSKEISDSEVQFKDECNV